MKWLLVLLGLALIGVAGAGLVASIDLLTTEIGAIYATCSAVALAAGLIILSLAALAYRIDALRKAVLRQGEGARRAAEITLAPPIPPVSVSAPTPPPVPMETPDIEPPHAPPPMAAEAAPMEEPSEEGAAAPTLVGRYSSGGANYSIFSDGSIEAETDEGAFRFASMSDFKAYIATKRAPA